MKKALLFLIPTLTLMVLPCLAQDQAETEQSDLDIILGMLRSDSNSYKIPVINKAMKLTGPEAETFWPIYRQYEKELADIGEQRVALIRNFMAHQRRGTMDDKNAKDLGKKSLDLLQERVDLLKKYHKKISKALSPMRGAQFLQVEYQIALFVDLNIVSEVPMLESQP